MIPRYVDKASEWVVCNSLRQRIHNEDQEQKVITAEIWENHRILATFVQWIVVLSIEIKTIFLI